MANQEITLTGGKLNADIVRIGDTVHRAQGSNASFVHELLKYLEKASFSEAPRFLGVDDENREIITYFEGELYPGSGYKLTDEKLQNVAKLIRRYHDVTAGTELAGTSEIVTHGDLGTHNTVFQGDTPVGLIDWDGAAPGTRLRDFAYAVDSYTDLVNKTIPLEEQVRRVQLMCEAYSWQNPDGLLADIRADYRRALDKHRREDNKKAVEVFEGLNEWFDVLIPKMISRLPR